MQRSSSGNTSGDLNDHVFPTSSLLNRLNVQSIIFASKDAESDVFKQHRQLSCRHSQLSGSVRKSMQHDSQETDAGRLLESGKYSDLTLRCDDCEWEVHRTIVCAHSTLF